MEIWLIRDGEKSGPFPDYQIRRRISAGELLGTDPAWHEGLAGWLPLSEIPVFESEFRTPEPVPEPLVETPPAAATSPEPPPPLPGSARIGRRFWARWLDIHLYVALWWFLFWFARADIRGLLFSPFAFFTQLIPWVVIEILLIHRFATTPGKWLMGIRVLNADGSRLTLSQSTRRAVRVFTVGIGMRIPFVILFCMGLSAYTALKVRATVWDHLGGHRIVTAALSPLKTILLAVILLGSVFLQAAVTGPHSMEAFRKDLKNRQTEALLKIFENDPVWFLPRRHP